MSAHDSIQFDEIDKYGPQTHSRAFAVPAEDLGREEVEKVGEIQIDVQARKGDLAKEYIVEGTVQFIADLECSRCVEPYPFANTSSFHLRYRPRPAVAETKSEQEIEITADELDIELYVDRSLSLREMAVDQVQLSIPMKPLCNEACPGLCPLCGANLAREECSCQTPVVDERWGALAGIRDGLAKKTES